MNTSTFNNTSTSNASNFFKALIICLAAFYLFDVAEVLATTTNPLNGVKFGSETLSASTDMTKVFGFFIKLFITALPFLIIVFVFADSLIAIANGLKESRRSGEWASFFTTLLMVLLGLAVVLFVGYFLFEILGKFGDFWTFT